MIERRTQNGLQIGWIVANFCVFVFLCACEPQSIHSRTVAHVGSQKITVTDLALRLLQTPGLKEAPFETKLKSAKILLDSLIDDDVLFLEAQNRGIVVADREIEHHFRHQKALLGQAGLFRFQKESLIDDASIKAQYRQQLTVTAFLKSLHEGGQIICETLSNMQNPKSCLKKEDFLRNLRKKYRIDLNNTNIPLALRVLGERA